MKYLEELRRDLRNIFDEDGVVLIERLVARHDNRQLRFDTDEEALFSIMGICDNAASEEKTIDAFTKVPGNELVAVGLYRLAGQKKGGDAKGDAADEAMKPLRLEMENNIAAASKAGQITALQHDAYMNAIKADLTLKVGELALEALGMHKSASGVELTAGVLTIRHTRSPLYAELRSRLGEPLAQSRIYDCVKEYKDRLPHLDKASDLAVQDLSCEPGPAGDGAVWKIVFKIEDADPATRPLDYTQRVYDALLAEGQSATPPAAAATPG